MTREEAIKIIDCYDINFYDLSGEKIPAYKLAEAFDMAIEALSAPQTDLISRADAIELAVDVETPKGTYESAIYVDDLMALPSADAVHGWIPCSERLPSESGDYLCTIPLDADETYTEVLMFHKCRFYEDDDEWGATFHDDVLAWMPLPTPYKGGDDE